jgi:hypothetical protein
MDTLIVTLQNVTDALRHFLDGLAAYFEAVRIFISSLTFRP